MNMIPPINSFFHAKMSKASKINEGMRCIKKAPICCQNESSDENASNANRLTKAIASMHNMRGNQYHVFTDVFTKVCFKKLNVFNTSS